VFGLLGIWSALREKAGSEHGGRDLRIFLGLYAILMFVISSAIPYKTPWSILSALQPLIIMAGCGLATFLTWLGARRKRYLGIVIIIAVFGHLTWQAYLSNFKYYDDPINPYVYSHPTDDVNVVARAVRDVGERSPDGLAMPVQVVSPGDDYWPLPWYLRALPSVGWWNAITDDFVLTPVILAAPEVEPTLMRRIYEEPPPGERPLYVPLFDRPMFLRPGKEIRGYIRLDLREKLRHKQ
jgi:predicted membrane-bound mannosyltransferase